MRVLKVMRQYLGISRKVVKDTDPYLLACTAHLIEDIRQKRNEGYWSFLDALRHDGLLALFSLFYGTYLEYEGGLSTLIVAKTSLIDKCVGSALLLSKLDPLSQFVLPGGLFGSIVGTVLRGYNLLFFPALAGITNLASLAATFICLTQLPPLIFSAVQRLFRATKKLIRRGYVRYYSEMTTQGKAGSSAGQQGQFRMHAHCSCSAYAGRRVIRHLYSISLFLLDI